MENPELGNTSTKLDKKNKPKLYSDKHAVSADPESFVHANVDVKPRRSFWRSLFRKQHKKNDVKELVPDPKAAVPSARLNAIFEEPKTPDEKEHVDEEIEDIKKTLQRISPVVVEATPPPSVLLSGIAPPTSEVARDESILEYLSDVSSTSSAASDAPEAPSALGELETDLPAPGAAAPDSKKAPEPRESSLGRDGYSFEYSETSDASVDEDKADKVITFDEKVEQKDADSNIVVRELNLGEEDAAEDEKTLQEEEEIEMIGLGADREEVVTGSGVVLVLPSSGAVTTQEDDVADQDAEEMLPTERFPADTLTTSGSAQTLQHHLNRHHHHHHQQHQQQTEVCLPACTGSVGYRLDDFFKMIFQQTSDDQVVNYSVAYDPIFANFNVQCCPATIKTMEEAEAEEAAAPFFYGEKQKVVRKRKMMSLLHDKHKMAEYLKEIEKEEETKHVNMCSAPQNSPNTVLQQQHQQQHQQQIEPEANQKEILFVLENTKKKLQTYLESDSEVLSLYPDMFNATVVNNTSDNNGKNDVESESELSVVPTAVGSKQRFANIGAEIESIFAELLLNVSELKEACVEHGATHDAHDSEPPVTMRPLGARGAAAALLDDILERVWAARDEPPTASLHAAGARPAGAASLQRGLERNEQLLEALKDEMCEYQPTPAAAIADQPSVEQQLVIDLNKIPRNLLPLLAEPEMDGGGGPLDKSKRFAPYYEDDRKSLRRTTSPPEVTESLKHIFFGEESSGRTTIHSEFNLLEDMSPRAGPSRDTATPSLPSESSLQFETLMQQQFSRRTGTSSSLQDELPLAMVDFFNDDASASSGAQPPTSNNNLLQLERKSPETNLHPLSKADIERSIADDMNTFQESITKISKINQKTAEMLCSSSFSTPEGSLSILSTITENMLETMSKKSSSERYPQFIPGCEDPPNTNTPTRST